MDTALGITLVVLFSLAMLAIVLRTLVNLWLNYSLRMSVLQKLDANAEPLQSPGAVEKIVDTIVQEVNPKSNHLLTGLFLTLMGIGGIAAGRAIREGASAVGLENGGKFCIFLGILFALTGAASWAQHRRPRSPKEPTVG